MDRVLLGKSAICLPRRRGTWLAQNGIMSFPSCYSQRALGTIRQAVILAAGRGRSVGEPNVVNCLSTVGGVPLILRTLRMLGAAGIKRAAIVAGFDSPHLRREVEGMKRAEPSLPEVVFIENPAWDRPNGLSVLAARKFVSERTLLVMADQIAAPRLVREMVELPGDGETNVLAVDYDLSRVFDFDDATKVKVRAGHRKAARRSRRG
jgi:1L-myo-inositol 1-phosphate cytidylyltransferase